MLKPLVPITTAAALISSKDPGQNMENDAKSTSSRAVPISRQTATSPPVAPSTEASRTMRAASVSDLGRNVDDVLDVVDNFSKVDFDPADPKNAGYALVRVQACALAPGDVRVLSGRTREVQGPPSFPYIPGGDVCGIVEAVADGEPFVRPGDSVVSQFHVNRGGLAEYAVVKTAFCARKPPRLTPSEAAATASSGTAAVLLSRNVKRGDRVR